jgi:hypothetical protein
LGAGASIHGPAIGVGVFGFLDVCRFAFGPGVNGVDVKQNVDD